jgi:hypothetical protein
MIYALIRWYSIRIFFEGRAWAWAQEPGSLKKIVRAWAWARALRRRGGLSIPGTIINYRSEDRKRCSVKRRRWCYKTCIASIIKKTPFIDTRIEHLSQRRHLKIPRLNHSLKLSNPHGSKGTPSPKRSVDDLCPRGLSFKRRALAFVVEQTFCRGLCPFHSLFLFQVLVAIQNEVQPHKIE